MRSYAENFLQICVNLQKYWNNAGLIVENVDLSHINLAVPSEIKPNLELKSSHSSSWTATFYMPCWVVLIPGPIPCINRCHLNALLSLRHLKRLSTKLVDLSMHRVGALLEFQAKFGHFVFCCQFLSVVLIFLSIPCIKPCHLNALKVS